MKSEPSNGQILMYPFLWGETSRHSELDLVLPQSHSSLLSSLAEVPMLPQEISLAPYTGKNPESRKMLFAPGLMSLVSEKNLPDIFFSFNE